FVPERSPARKPHVEPTEILEDRAAYRKLPAEDVEWGKWRFDRRRSDPTGDAFRQKTGGRVRMDGCIADDCVGAGAVQSAVLVEESGGGGHIVVKKQDDIVLGCRRPLIASAGCAA